MSQGPSKRSDDSARVPPAESSGATGGAKTGQRSPATGIGNWIDRLIIAGAALLPLQFYGTWTAGPVTLIPSELLFALAIALILVNAAREREFPIVLSVASVAAILLLLAGLISLPGALDRVRGLHLELRLAFDVAVFVFLAPRFRSPLLGARAAQAIVVGAVVACLFALYQFFASAVGLPTFLRPLYTKQLFGFPRVHSFMREPLYLDSFLLIAVAFLSVTLLTSRRTSWFTWAGYVLILLTIGLTLSRGAYFGLAAMAVVVTAVAGSWRLDVRRLAGLAAGLVVAVAISLALFQAVAPDGARVAISHVATGYFDVNAGGVTGGRIEGSIASRYQTWGAAVHAFASHPVRGVGIGNFGPWYQRPSPLYAPNDPRWLTVNNVPLEIAAELGSLGFIPWAVLLVSLGIGCLWALRRGPASPVAAVAGGGAVALAGLVTQFQSFSAEYQPHYWLVLAVIGGVSLVRAETSSSPTNALHEGVLPSSG